MKKYAFTIIIFLLVLICASSCKTLFIENFNSNKLGWIEERTERHNLYLKNGHYVMENKDSVLSASHTSTKYWDKSWHLNLPSSYTVESFLHIDKNTEKVPTSIEKEDGEVILRLESKIPILFCKNL